MIERTIKYDSVNHYKVDKINNYEGLDKGVDWVSFLKDAIAMLHPTKEQIHVKKCLHDVAPEKELFKNDIDLERDIAST